jgi:hypothetical protein
MAAVTDAYVTKAEYNARANRTATADDATLTEELVAASRLFDHLMGLAPGALNAVTSATRVFSGRGRTRLRLEDGEGQHLLRTVGTDGIAVDTDGDGDADESFDLGDTWCVGLPRNAAGASQPYDSFELLPYSAALLTEWPVGRWNVSVTGAWGFAAIPEGVKDAVCSVVRDLREVHATGGAGNYQQVDATLQLTDQTWRVIRALKSQYSYRTGARTA